jgi:hypothetical protein
LSHRVTGREGGTIHIYGMVSIQPNALLKTPTGILIKEKQLSTSFHWRD